MRTHTTLGSIMACGPCFGGWRKVITGLYNIGKINDKQAEQLLSCEVDGLENFEVSFEFILENNDIADAVWSLQSIHYKEMLPFLCDCFDILGEHYGKRSEPQDPQIILNISKTMRDYSEGKTTFEELKRLSVSSVTAFANKWGEFDSAYRDIEEALISLIPRVEPINNITRSDKVSYGLEVLECLNGAYESPEINVTYNKETFEKLFRKHFVKRGE